MTEEEFTYVMEIIRQELEDIEVEEDGTCRWGDVANANTHIQARLRGIKSVLYRDPVSSQKEPS